jgi:RHS repeat-associated protein
VARTSTIGQLRPVAQLDGSGTNVVARFVYGSKPNVPDYMITPGGTYRILSDHLGSPRAVVDVSTGNVIETINFDEFGNETDTLAETLPAGYVRIPFGFAGGLYDPDTTLVRFGARDYDASVGRWTTKDRVRFAGGRNLYMYIGDDPINGTDVRGTAPFCNYSNQPVLVGGGTCPGNDHTGGFGTGYVLRGQCVGAGSPLAGPLTDVDVVDFNGDGNVQPPIVCGVPRP